jgi:protoporphyrinogen oxidase
MAQKEAIIIGAGPAGLTAAYELLLHTDIRPVIFEQTEHIGGISMTVNHGGNRIDIGGHRFFSRSTTVMDWWAGILPLQGAPARDDRLLGRAVPLSPLPGAPDPEVSDRVMLARSRLSRILFQRKFFDYPLALSLRTIAQLGAGQMGQIGASYVAAKLRPIRPEASLEDFLINRFGRGLYRTFFEDYTQKVWGVPCRNISKEWGEQRIKGLSIRKALFDAARNFVSRDGSLAQRKTETSLIRRFLYPKLGPGQMWEQVALLVEQRGGQIHRRHEVVGLRISAGKAVEVCVTDHTANRQIRRPAEYVFSTMPVRKLVGALDATVPAPVARVAQGLAYRDFITVGLLLTKLKVRNESGIQTINDIIPDNWIYVQEPDVKVGRLQLFNNWSPYMVRDANTVWMGLEYFCNAGDSLWSMSDRELARFAVEELVKINVIERNAVLDSTVIRVPYAYPAYFGTYADFGVVRAYLDGVSNLFLIGRNGMHRYNNQDHSMLAAMAAVEGLRQGNPSKERIWAVNAQEDYHEQR